MSTRLERFVNLSAALTGVSEVALWGTGQADAYLDALEEIVPDAIIADLFTAFAALPPGGASEPAIGTQILGDGRLGPVARSLILLWYRGFWSQLPEDWRGQFGASAADRDHLLSGDAYQAGLQWVVAGAHPPGARPQGYASWGQPPRSLEPDIAL